MTAILYFGGGLVAVAALAIIVAAGIGRRAAREAEDDYIRANWDNDWW